MRDKGRRGEDEFERIDFFQLSFQRRIGIDRKTGCGDFELGIGFDGSFEVFTQQMVDVVDYFHLVINTPMIVSNLSLARNLIAYLEKFSDTI